MKTLNTTGKRSIYAAALLLGALTLAAPARVFADSENNASQHAGLDIGGNATWFHDDKVIGDGWYGGADLRFHFAPAIALEGSTSFQQSGGANYYPTQASLLIYLTPQYRLTPYILGGGTWYFQNGGAVSSTLFGPHAGAGLEFFLSHDWSVDASWRYLWVENPASGGGGYFNHSYTTNSYMVTTGLHFHF